MVGFTSYKSNANFDLTELVKGNFRTLFTKVSWEHPTYNHGFQLTLSIFLKFRDEKGGKKEVVCGFKDS
ncbi:MAG: hypothetical protein MUO78_05310 [candidate division Zixibacteria bacterium]|nr:hypothetical protein [candidate division Zixibacteria bacterium]